MSKTFIIFLLTVGLIAGAGLGWLVNSIAGHDRTPYRPTAETVDSIVKPDTLFIERPKETLIRRALKDSIIIVPVHDTIRVRDTTFVRLEREEKVYEDSSFRAVVSGYEPRLDSIEVRTKTVFITRTLPNNNNIARKAHRFGLSFGAQGGVGYVRTFGGDPGMGVYTGLGIGLTYTF